MSNVKLIIVGDSTDGLKHAPLAMWYAQKMRRDGGQHGLQRVFHDGVAMIRVLLDDNTGDKAYIEAGGGCPLITYNGYLDTFSGLYDSDTSGGRRMIELQADTENLPRTRNGESIAGDPKMHGIRKVPAYNSQTDPAPMLPPGQELSSDRFPLVSVNRDAHDAEFRDLFVRYKPSRFSGIMRKVMQCTFGSGAWWGISYMGTSNTDPPFAQRKLKVNFQWNDSWGVVLAPGKDGSQGGHYFLIQIILNTVQWVPADFCVHKVIVDGVDDYAPVLRRVDTTQAVSIGTLPALGGSSCSKAVGWSFSYMEPKASVVIYGEDGSNRVTVKRVDVEFGFANGVPNSIQVTQGTTNIFWAPIDGRTQSVFLVPEYPMGADVPVLATYQVRDQFTMANPDPYRVANIPVHIYYQKGNADPEIVGYSYAYTASTGFRSVGFSVATMGGYGTDFGSTDYITWGFTLNGDSLPAITGGGGKNWYVAVPANFYTVVSGNYTITNQVITKIGTNGLPYFYEVIGDTHQTGDLDIQHDIYTKDRDSMYSSLALAVDDIECLYIYREVNYAAYSERNVERIKVNGGYSVKRGRTPMVSNIGDLEAFAVANGYGAIEGVNFVSESGDPEYSFETASISGGSVVSSGSLDLSGRSEKTVMIYGGHEGMLVDGGAWKSVMESITYPANGLSIRHSSAGVTPSKFFTYESAPGRLVVSMDGEEYNPTNAVTGWLGVV